MEFNVMKMKITRDEDNVEFDFENSDTYKFELNQPIELNSLIEYISELDSKIECTPVTYQAYTENDTEASSEMFTFIKYAFKIINAFNECVDSTETQTDVTDEAN